MSTKTNLSIVREIEGVGIESRRTAERISREQRADRERQEAIAVHLRAIEEATAKALRKKRIAVTLVVTFLALSVFNYLRLTDSDAPSSKTELMKALREELLFEVESIELFAAEEGRVPDSLEEMGYPESPDLVYVNLGPHDYRLTISDSGTSLTYESSMDPDRVFGGQLND